MNSIGICNICGMPQDLCACTDIARTGQFTIKIFVEKRKWGREVTVIDGLDGQNLADLPKLTKKLKKKLATGGTYKNGRIELQGNHKDRVKEILVAEGFPEDAIEMQ